MQALNLLALDLKTTGPGVHAMHIHQNGKCDGPDFKTAGDHFNPGGKEHGHANPKGSHAGDLPNIRAAKDGAVRQDIEAHGVSLKTSDATSLATSTGTSLIIHAKPDDGKTNPSGNSGDRVYCAVLTEPTTAVK